MVYNSFGAVAGGHIQRERYSAMLLSSITLSGISLLLVALLWRLWDIRRAFSKFNRLPTYSVLLSPVYPLGRMLPWIPRVAAGSTFGWLNAYETMFGKVGSDIVVLRSLIPLARPYLLIADATALKAIYQDHSAFPKPAVHIQYGKRGNFGPNLVTSEHDEWRKHRRIAGPSFSESNNRLVWESSIEVILGYFNKWIRDGKGGIIKVDDFTQVTKQIAFMVFTAAGFGMSADWDADREVPSPGHSMPFMRALKVATEGLILRAAVPRWLLSLSQRGRLTSIGFTEMEKYMLEMIEERKSSTVLDERKDLMSNWIHASMTGDNSAGKEAKLNEREILGNVFVFLVAGHETTAYSLASALALLSVHQEEQEELYKHVRSVVPEGRLPTYQDVPHLTRVIAVISETLRLYPPASLVLKEAAEDCTIPTSTGESLVVPKGTGLVPMIDAIHHNDKYWPDPYKFRPSRFLGDYNKDAFLPFSTGARGCIGRRFSEIEQIAVLSVIVLHYKVAVLEEPQYAYETAEEREARVLQRDRPFLVKPVRVPLVFTPREGTDIQSC